MKKSVMRYKRINGEIELFLVDKETGVKVLIESDWDEELKHVKSVVLDDPEEDSRAYGTITNYGSKWEISRLVKASGYVVEGSQYTFEFDTLSDKYKKVFEKAVKIYGRLS